MAPGHLPIPILVAFPASVWVGDRRLCWEPSGKGTAWPPKLTGWLQAPSISHLGLCRDTLSRTHDLITIMCTPSLHNNTYWPYVSDTVLGSWILRKPCLANGERSPEAVGAEKQHPTQDSRGLQGIPCILPNWRGWTRWSQGPLPALKCHSPCLLPLISLNSFLNNLVFHLQWKIWVSSEL